MHPEVGCVCLLDELAPGAGRGTLGHRRTAWNVGNSRRLRSHVAGQVDQTVGDLRSQRLQVGRVLDWIQNGDPALRQATGAPGRSPAWLPIQPAGLEVEADSPDLQIRVRFRDPARTKDQVVEGGQGCLSHFCNVCSSKDGEFIHPEARCSRCR